MSQLSPSFDPIWQDSIYGQGQQLNRYPFDIVVSFIYRHYPRDKSRSDVKILEVGCGAGNNLWFAAREGFQVAGIDGSPNAITYAKRRFAEEGLTGDFRVGDFTQLPFDSDCYDLVIDRGSITCCGFLAGKKAVAEVRRVLKLGGKFLCNPYSDRHSSYVSGQLGPDGVTVSISTGLVGVGQVCFYGRRDVDDLLAQYWNILSVRHLALVEQKHSQYTIHAEWRVVAEKIA
jgi:SAM-dependent methyltransferase